MERNKVPAKKRDGSFVDEKTSRTLGFLKRTKHTLASAVALEVEVITALVKGEIRANFAHAILKWITEIIQRILRG